MTWQKWLDGKVHKLIEYLNQSVCVCVTMSKSGISVYCIHKLCGLVLREGETAARSTVFSVENTFDSCCCSSHVDCR